MKLQQGDYVTDLTDEQFDELMDLQPDYYLKYYYEDNCGLFWNGSFIGMLRHDYKKECINLLSFEEFKQRSINLYKPIYRKYWFFVSWIKKLFKLSKL